MAKKIVFALLFSVLLSSVNTAWTPYDRVGTADGMYPQCAGKPGSDQNLGATNTITDVSGLTAGTHFPGVITAVSYIGSGTGGLVDVEDVAYSISGTTITLGVTQSTGLLTEAYNEQTATATGGALSVELFMQGVLITKEGTEYWANSAFDTGPIIRNKLDYPATVTSYTDFKALSVVRNVAATTVKAYIESATTNKFITWTLSGTAGATITGVLTTIGNWGTGASELFNGLTLPAKGEIQGTQDLAYVATKNAVYTLDAGNFVPIPIAAFNTFVTGATLTSTNFRSAQLLNDLSVLSIQDTAGTKVKTIVYRNAVGKQAWADATNYFEVSYTDAFRFDTDSIQSVVIAGNANGQIHWVKYDPATDFTHAIDTVAVKADIEQITGANQVRIAGDYLFALSTSSINIYHRRSTIAITKVRSIGGIVNLVAPTATVNLYRVSIPCQCLTGTTSSAAWALRRFSCFASTLKCIATVVQTSSASTPTWGAC